MRSESSSLQMLTREQAIMLLRKTPSAVVGVWLPSRDGLNDHQIAVGTTVVEAAARAMDTTVPEVWNGRAEPGVLARHASVRVLADLGWPSQAITKFFGKKDVGVVNNSRRVSLSLISTNRKFAALVEGVRSVAVRNHIIPST